MTGKAPRGMVLFIVAIVIAMLAVAALALLSLLTTEYEATVLRGDEIQAGQLVQSGIEFIAQTVDTRQIEQTPSGAEFSGSFTFPADQPMPDDWNGASIPVANSSVVDQSITDTRLYDNPDMFRGVEVVPASLGRPARGAGRFTVFSPRVEQGRLRGIRFGLVNESSRLHLGAVLEWENESPGQGARSLMKLPGMTPAIADSILDWIDADKTARSSGAESDYYQRTGVPYRPRNAIPVSLEELLLVRDMRRSLLFGTDESFSYGAKMSDLERVRVEAEIQSDQLFQSPTETDVAASQPESSGFFSDLATDTQMEASLPWCFLLTTLSAEKLVDPNGHARIFLNDGNIEFLEEQLRSYLDEESLRFVIAWRRNKGRIDDPIDLLDAAVTVKESNEELKSPFTLENATGEDRFLKLLDFATASPSVVVSGRVNVNEASRIVLEAVPGLNSPMVTQILGRRGTLDNSSYGKRRQDKLRHPIWLLSEKIVDKATMKKLSKHLTTSGDVYRAQVVGFFDLQGTVSRAELVVDATVKPPRQIFSKDLTMFGGGFQ